MHDNKQSSQLFKLSNAEYDAIKREKCQYENPRSASIGALKIVQKQRGWISDEAIYAISNVLGIPPSDLEGVATFYSGIFRQPVGRHVIRYCDSIVCYITGYQKIKEEIERILNINLGQTTSDGRFTLLPTCCLGNCDKGPTMMINDDTYSCLTPEIILDLLERYK